ncbi:MAG: TylF/MycF/NovP-related O-methyltransferase [Patescibacteria group bacterium]|nr:TylF/MycF/NovP-related O-methyltransferase [Patescibacteria group bacterium]
MSLNKKIPKILCNPAIVFEHAWEAYENCWEGACLECGCYEGFNSVFLNFGLRKLCTNFKQYAADTFSGFPKNYGCQKVYKQKNLSVKDKKFVVSELRDRGIIPLQGDVKKTLLTIPNKEKFFFVFLDLDVYEPTNFAWKFLNKRVLKGGRVGFHDYQTPSLPGITELCNKILKLKGWHEVYRVRKKERDNKFLFLEKE